MGVGHNRPVANVSFKVGYLLGDPSRRFNQGKEEAPMITSRFFVGEPGSESQGNYIVLGDPYRTQDDRAVYACEVTMGSGSSMAIFGGTPLSAIANAVTVANGLVGSQGQVSWA